MDKKMKSAMMKMKIAMKQMEDCMKGDMENKKEEDMSNEEMD